MDTFESADKQLDASGHIVRLSHINEPYRPRDLGRVSAHDVVTESATEAIPSRSMSVRELAEIYVKDAIPHFGISAQLTNNESVFFENAIAEEDVEHQSNQLLFDHEKSVMGNATVTYSQAHGGIPIWESGIVVQIEEDAMQVIGSQSTFKHELAFKMPKGKAAIQLAEVAPETIVQMLRLDATATVEINYKKLFIYQYDQANRVKVPHNSIPPFALPPVAENIKAGRSYLVAAIQFVYNSKKVRESGWIALIEVKSGSVLHLRSLAGCNMHATVPVAVESKSDELSAEGLADELLLETAVVFFDIGETLGRAVIDGNNELSDIEVFSDVPEILKEMNEMGLRIGIISDPGNFNTGHIRSLLEDSGAMEFIDEELLVFGPKSDTAIFRHAAELASVQPDRCMFVGETFSERQLAAQVSFRVSSTPIKALHLLDSSSALAWVYSQDPFTKAGASGVPPTSSTETLDSFRDLVRLQGLISPEPNNNQELVGEYVRVENIDAPHPALPSSPPPGDFRYSVDTNNFGAVNAYYNCDRLFRMLENFGIDVHAYFDGTDFPIRVDHRVRYPNAFGIPTANSVNASAPGFQFPPRSDGFRFALAAHNTSVGMATAWRVVLHEFGHALLWDQVGSPNFRFAHSAGDAMAAILNDIDNRGNRAATFPWVGISRSHTRPVDELAWYGPSYEPFDRNGQDRAGYVAEQMLSSTLFRIYQSLGGDSSDRREREFAACYVVFLIVKSIGMMSFANNPEHPDGYADLLMQADTGTFRFNGESVQIGLLRKVVRWGFEMQGAFRPVPHAGSVRTNQIGRPPKVDVFINDGRDGEYYYAASVDSSHVWNRQSPDNGSISQQPIPGQENALYLRISNRGRLTADNIEVSAYQSADPNALWPNNWQPLEQESLLLTDSIDSGADIVAGPIRWVPSSLSPTVMVSVSASGDFSNLGRFSLSNPVSALKLVALDNNLAQRTFSTQPIGIIV